MKEQEEFPEKDLNKKEVSNLSETKYKVTVFRMLLFVYIFFNFFLRCLIIF